MDPRSLDPRWILGLRSKFRPVGYVRPPLLEGRPLAVPERGEFFVYDSGEPHSGAPTVLLLHGMACTALLNWAPILEKLSQSYRVVLFDQRWHGRGMVAPSFSIQDCAEDAACVLESLGVDLALVAGYSMGGAIAQSLAISHPEKVEALLLCSTAARWRHSMAEAAFYSLLSLGALLMSNLAVSRLGKRVERASSTASTQSRDWAWREFRSYSPWVILPSMVELSRYDSRQRLGELAMPVTVLATERDRAIPYPRQEELARLVPHAKLYSVDKGHVGALFSAAWADAFHASVAELQQRATGVT